MVLLFHMHDISTHPYDIRDLLIHVYEITMFPGFMDELVSHPNETISMSYG